MTKKDNSNKREEAIKRGKRIYTLRIDKGISRRGLARNIDISDTALANIENGVTESLTIELGKKICENLHVSFNDLFDIEIPTEYDVKSLIAENEKLKERVNELMEKIEDKKIIIDLLSKNDNDFLIAIASYISKKEDDENPERIDERMQFDIDSLLKWREKNYDPSDRESMISYITTRIKKHLK